MSGRAQSPIGLHACLRAYVDPASIFGSLSRKKLACQGYYFQEFLKNG